MSRLSPRNGMFPWSRESLMQFKLDEIDEQRIRIHRVRDDED
jgi:hypothetical protein